MQPRDSSRKDITAMSFVQGVGSTDATSSSDAPNLRPFANLDLTADQSSQIRSILQNAQSQGLSPTDVQNQINNVLTQQQQQTLQTDLSAQKSSGHHHHHGHHHSGGSSSSSAASTSSTSPTTATDAFGIPVDPTLSSGVTATDLQNQSSAATTIAQQQLQNDLLNGGSST
jgi:hypothetical protein